MRFRRLFLDRFGHFEDDRIDFGPKPEDGPDFHVLYGLNEAGKTTLLFAILRLLYGFRRADPYGFRHRDELRVGAEIEGLQGQGPLRVWRVKRNNALIDENGGRLADDLFTAALGGLGEEDYRRIFSLDRESVIQGSKDISEGRGEAARAFFAAHAGLSNLTATLDGVERAAGALFRPSGRKDAAHRALAETRRLSAEAKRHDMTAGAYDTLDRAARRARAESDAEAAAVQALAGQVAAIDRLIDLRDRGSKLKALKETLAGRYADHPDWPADPHPMPLATLNGDAASARAALGACEEEIARIAVRLDQTDPDDAIISQEQRIEELDRLRKGAEGAIDDLLRRRAEAEEIADQMIRRLDGLLVEPTTALREDLVLEREPMAALSSAANDLLAAEKGAAQARTDFDRARRELDDVRGERAEDLAAPLLEAEVASRIGLLDPQGVLDAAEDARSAILRRRSDFEDALAEIQTAGPGFETAPRTDLAPDAVREEAAERARQAEAARAARVRIAALDGEVETGHAEIARRESAVGQDVADAAVSRNRRDAAWAQHRKAMTDGTADLFEAEMGRHDLVENQRFAHAREIGAIAGLRAATAVRARDRDDERARAEAAERSVAALDAAHRDRIAGIGLPPAFSRDELADWLRAARKASQCERRMRDEERSRKPDLDREATVARELCTLMPDLEGLGPARVLAVAVERLAAHRVAEAGRERAGRQIERIEQAVRGAEEALARSEQAVIDARRAWEKSLQDNLPANHGLRDPREAIGALSEVATDAIEWRSLLKRARAMRRDARIYIEAVGRIDRGLGAPDGGPQGAAAADAAAGQPGAADDRRLIEATDKAVARARLLGQGLSRARTARKRIAEDRTALKDFEETRRAERERLSQAEAAIGLYRARFPETIDTSTVAALERAVREAREATGKREEAAALEADLKAALAHAEGDDPAAFAGTLAERDLEAERQSAVIDLTGKRKIHEAALIELGAAEHALKALGGGDAAAANAERAAQEQQLADAVLAAARKRMGLHLARRAIDAFRQANRSETMRSAGEVFRGLTRGRYGDLTSRSEGGLEKLVAHCADEDVVRTAADMSAGTRMQLYFALRLAAWRDHVRRGVRCPFVADDVFESFDDHRTQSACQEMREIGFVGQSIYLTHHSDVGRRAISVSGGGHVVRLMPGVDDAELVHIRGGA